MSASPLFKPSTAATLALATATILSAVGCSQNRTASGGPDVYRSRSDQQTARLDSQAVEGPAPTQARSNAYQPSSTAMAFPTGDRNSSVLLVEKNAPKQVRINQPYTYQLKVTNLTDQSISNVTVNEQLGDNFRVTNVANATTQPANARTAAANVDADAPRGMNTYTLGELKPRESRTIEVTGTPTAAGDLSSCTTLNYQPSLCSVAQVVAPSIRLAKTGPQQADICQEVVWNYAVANEGTGVAPGVVINDRLPQGLQTIDGKDSVQIAVGDLESGKTKEYRVRLKANQTGQFASAASARTSFEDEVKSDNVQTTVIAPALALALEGPREEYIGRPLQYTMTVRNEGQADARDVKLQMSGVDTRNAQLAVLPAADRTGDATLAAGRVEGATAASRVTADNLGTIPAGQSRRYSITVPANQAGTINLGATANAACARPATAQVTTNVRAIAALLLEVVDREDPVRAGNNTVYTIAVKNQGSAPDTNIRVRATLPAEQQFVGAQGSSRGTTEGQTITFAPVATLAPGETAKWDVEVKALQVGDVKFAVDMTSDAVKQGANETEPTKQY